MTSVISNLIKNTAHTEDEVRRINLLNIMLLGIAGISILVMALILVTQTAVETNILFFGVILLAVVGITYLINQKISGYAASILFLLSLTIVIAFSDDPEQVINGRSLFYFTVPILLSSVLLKPYYAFIMTIVVGIVMNLIAFNEGLGFQFLTPLSFIAVALVAWLSSKSLNDALAELRTINLELDQRVEERTEALQLTNFQLEEEIQERIKIESELKQTRDQAVSASLFKSELLARVSHELRTPLGAILGYLEMLRAEIYGPLEDEQKETVTTIIDVNKALTDLVNELLDQARLEAGQIRVEDSPFSPLELTNSVHTRLLILAETQGLKFEKIYDDTLPAQLCGDIHRLQQILINLIGNAIKFTEEGFVRLEVFDVDGNWWGMKVSDSGMGIPQEETYHIFEVFHQVDNTYTRSRGGFGLGLSIVKQLVDLMGGTVSVESEVGKGSQFLVQLPKRIP